MNRALLSGLICVLWTAPAIHAGDWPMASADARRSSTTAEDLPPALQRAWSKQLPALKPAWPDQTRLQGDGVYRPIVLAGLVIVASSADDSVAAYDLADGREIWRFFTGGPVRVPPAGDSKGGRVFVGSDDGYLYALDVKDGSLLWRFKGAPRTRLVIGNERLIDTWPVRGGPVVSDDGKVYFTAGIWPFMGIFIHCLDAATGKPVWSNSGDGSSYVQQPHNTPSFGSVAPQGALALAGDRLFVPNGRAVPACYDRHDGKLLYFNMPGKVGGDTVVVADDADSPMFFNGGLAFDLEKGKPLAKFEGQAVVSGNEAWAVTEKGIVAYDLAGLTEQKGFKPGPKFKLTPEASVPAQGLGTLIRAGKRLYAGGERRVAAFDLPLQDDAEPAWTAETEGIVCDLLATDGRLLAVTEQGQIYCFSKAPSAPAKPRAQRNERQRVERSPGSEGARDTAAESIRGSAPVAVAPSAAPAAWADHAGAVLEDSGTSAGYGLVLGAASEPAVRDLVRASSLHIVVLEKDPAAAARARGSFQRDGLYGSRVSVVVGGLGTTPLPPYFANLIVAPEGARADLDDAAAESLFRSLHPFHGRAYLSLSEKAQAALRTAAVEKWAGQTSLSDFRGMLRLSRAGGPPGGGNWTHEHADAANTRVSKDSLVKAPLGLLWYGGSSNEDILPRHGHGPQPQVIDGRAIIEGMDVLRALDIYTGRVLWEAPLPGVGAFFDNTRHQAGANGTGSNYVSTSDTVYVALGASCVRLDTATGKELGRFGLPEFPELKDEREDAVWGHVSVTGDYLIGSVSLPPKSNNPAREPPKKKDPKEGEPPAREVAEADARAQLHPRSVGSKRLFVLDRRTGRLLWSATAAAEFRHNAVCAGGGKLFAIDRPAPPKPLRLTTLLGGIAGDAPATTQPAVETQPTTAPATGPAPRLRVFDLATGRELWDTSDDVFGTWLSYSQEHDVLMEAGRIARDTLRDEPRGMRAYRGASGDVLWHDKSATGPAMIRGGTVLKEKTAADLVTGAPVRVADPITGVLSDWTWTRMYGCNTPAVSQHLLTFRSGAAGFYDLARCGGTGNFGGFRSSCTNNLLVAGGVLVAPDYTRTCTCSYPLQTSLALVPDPDVEMWTFLGSARSVKDPVGRLGINFGGPGDRVDDHGTPWLEYPASAGPSPKVDVEVQPKKVTYFRRHASAVTGAAPWVTASGAKGVRSVTVTTNGDDDEPRAYTVRLYFAHPEPLAPGECVVDVAIQGRTVEESLDVVAAAKGHDRSLVREYQGVRAGEELKLEMKPAVRGAVPILCGLELIAEDSRRTPTPFSAP